MNDAPDYVKEGLDILSGTRTVERQAELYAAAVKKYGSEKAARKWVAPPGKSQHNHGQAADLGWHGGKLASAPAAVKQWLLANAGKYGLSFPMSHEGWHIEPTEARKGGKQARETPQDATVARGQALIEQYSADDGAGYVQATPSTGNAGEIYAKLATPFQVSAKEGDLQSWLADAEERYGDNPSMLAEVQRRLTNEWNVRAAQSKEALQAEQLEVFRGIIEGKKVSDFDPLTLQRIGPEGVSKLLTLEGKFGKGGDADKTDDATYYKLSQMPPEEFGNANLIDFADKLSGADFRTLADRQAALKRPAGAAGKRETDRTRTQIVGEAQNILGLAPDKEPEDASTMAQLNRALDGRIAAWMQNNGDKEPDGPAIQKMVDELILEGRTAVGYTSDTYKRVFQLTPEETSTFESAAEFADIPTTAQPRVALTYQKMWNRAPDEEAAVAMYNDMQRVALGGAPVPPEALDARIRQGLLQKLGRSPTDDEVSIFYRNWIMKAAPAE
jgi:hypothetical protein